MNSIKTISDSDDLYGNDYTPERRAYVKIDQYANRSLEIDESNDNLLRGLVAELDTINILSAETRSLIISSWAELDPSFAAFLNDADLYKTAIDDYLDSGNGDIQTLISYLKELHAVEREIVDINKLNGHSDELLPSTILNRLLRQRNLANVGSYLQNLRDTINQDYIFHKLLHTANINHEFFANVEYVQSLLYVKKIYDFVNKLGISDETRRTILARAYSPYIQADLVNPVMVEEIIEGRYDFTEDYELSIIEGFLGWQEDNTTKTNNQIGNLKKVILIALVTGILITNCMGVVASINHDNGLPQTVDDNYNNEDAPADHLIDINDTEPNEGHKNEVDGGSFTKMENTVIGDGSRGDQLLKSEMDPNVVKSSVWSLEGRQLEGLYKISTASTFNGSTNNFGWRTNPRNGSEIDFENTHIEVDQTSSATVIGGRIIDFPVRYGQIPIKIEINGVEQDSGRNYIYRMDDGSVSIRVDVTDFGFQDKETVNLTVHSVSGEYISTDLPDTNDRATPLDINEVPFAKEIRRITDAHGTSDYDKALKVAEFYREGGHFTYSLNRSYSEYYQNALSTNEYLQRINEVAYGDCDVVNTSMVHTLRAMGIPARMAYGFNNESPLSIENRLLESNEMHGWVEVFDSSEWRPVDGTPKKMDSYTAKILKDELGIGEGNDGNMSKSVAESLQVLLHSLKTFVEKDAGIKATALISVGTLLSSYFAYKKYREIYNNRVDNVERKILDASTNISNRLRSLGINVTPLGISTLVDLVYLRTSRKTHLPAQRHYAIRIPGYYQLVYRKREKLQRSLDAVETDNMHDVEAFLRNITENGEEEVKSVIQEYNIKGQLTDVSNLLLNRLCSFFMTEYHLEYWDDDFFNLFQRMADVYPDPNNLARALIENAYKNSIRLRNRQNRRALKKKFKFIPKVDSIGLPEDFIDICDVYLRLYK